jgi:CBS domain-containing protein
MTSSRRGRSVVHSAIEEVPGMKRVSELLDAKGYDVWTTTPDTRSMRCLMAARTGCAGRARRRQGGGIFSERDYARKVILKGKSSRDLAVLEIMTAPVFHSRPNQTTEECMALMTAKRIRHLPVMDGDRLVGVISIGDVVKSLISEQQWLIEMLEDYITGRR